MRPLEQATDCGADLIEGAGGAGEHVLGVLLELVEGLAGRARLTRILLKVPSNFSPMPNSAPPTAATAATGSKPSVSGETGSEIRRRAAAPDQQTRYPLSSSKTLERPRSLRRRYLQPCGGRRATRPSMTASEPFCGVSGGAARRARDAGSRPAGARMTVCCSSRTCGPAMHERRDDVELRERTSTFVARSSSVCVQTPRVGSSARCSAESVERFDTAPTAAARRRSGDRFTHSASGRSIWYSRRKFGLDGLRNARLGDGRGQRVSQLHAVGLVHEVEHVAAFVEIPVGKARITAGRSRRCRRAVVRHRRATRGDHRAPQAIRPASGRSGAPRRVTAPPGAHVASPRT